MTDLKSFYQKHIETYSAEVSKLKKQLFSLSLFRICWFILITVLVYFTFSNLIIATTIGLFGLIIFLYALVRYTKLKKKQALKKALLQINSDELRILNGDFQFKPEGEEFQEAKHAYCLDIDLFGKGSFFQNIDRTATSSGRVHLAQELKANNISEITERQNAIKDLSSKTEWRQNFQATAGLIKIESKTEDINNWLKSYQSKLPKFSKILALAFSGITFSILGLTIFNIIPQSLIGYWLFIGLIVSGIYVKSINHLAQKTGKIKDTFRQYASLLKAIESENFTSQLLINKQKEIKTPNNKASEIFQIFSKRLDALDNRNNLIGAIFGNGYFLLDIKNAYSIEQWISENKDTVSKWFEVVAFFDAYNSFGNYTFNHQHFVFPEITEHKTGINAKDLGHPLLAEQKRVTSDLTITKDEFFIVTGANMAGKSTFLRTVSLHIVMANVGLPVCASNSIYSPTKLITSMRTTDNLTEDSSYFFSELTRLKFIVDAIKADSYFIILDEILKGTNSKDKAEGSKKFVEKLVASNATGIIATHDLSLCQIEKDLAQVKNYYFDAFIENDELSFDYKFKKGICQNMNASFLLRKMEIV
jgi:DNA mismatch repair ATPase MutS